MTTTSSSNTPKKPQHVKNKPSAVLEDVIAGLQAAAAAKHQRSPTTSGSSPKPSTGVGKSGSGEAATGTAGDPTPADLFLPDAGGGASSSSGNKPPLPHPLLARRAATTSSAAGSVSPTPKATGNLSSATPSQGGGDGPQKGTHKRRVSWGDSAAKPPGGAVSLDPSVAASWGADPTPVGPPLEQGGKQSAAERGKYEAEMATLSPLPADGGSVTSVRGSSRAGGSASGSSTGRLSLRNLSAHSPMETEAEAHIQEALDELDPTMPGPSPAQETILGSVGQDVSPSVFNSRDGDNEENQKPALPLFRSSRGKSKKSTAEDLWQLTRDLALMQRKNTASSSVTSSASSGMDDDLGDAEDLARNAAKVVKRYQSDRFKDSSQKRDEVSPAAAMAAARFKGLLNKTKSTKNSIPEEIGAANGTGDGEQPSPTGTGSDDEEAQSEGKSSSTDWDDEKKQHGASTVAKMKRSTKVKAQFREFEDWLKFEKMSVWSYIKIALFFIMIPATGLAAILFYLAGNPPCGNGICRPKTNTNSTLIQTFVSASASWWIIFILVRQVVTLSLARATQAFVIDYLAMRTKFFVRVFGPLFTLFIVQSRGWPFTCFFWGVYDFATLYGRYDHAKHWLYWQDVIGLFNDSNPAGNVTVSSVYVNILIFGMVVGFFGAVKRCWLGLMLGRQTYLRYGDELAKVMKRALLVGQVASLARDIEVSKLNLADFGFHVNTSDDPSVSGSIASPDDENNDKGGILDGIDFCSRSARINELLGDWEEPEDPRKSEKANIASIIQFRQSLSCLNSPVPFSSAFGIATTRNETVSRAEDLFHRLMLSTPGAHTLTFDVIALLAIRRTGDLDEDKVKELIRLFRPDREGNLTLLDFVKSVDAVYKELRLLRASVSNSSKLDRAFENMINVFFYLIVLFICVAALGINPVLLFGSVSGFIIGFAFMIGSACSKYVEGLLLIFVRRPYNIGDRIHVSNPNADTSSGGSPGWIVKDVDLYTTTVILGATNEVATYSNWSLAASRIINAARSPKASLLFFLKFPIDTPYEKLQVFKSSIEKFIKARPRDWAAFLAFRSTRVEADLGFVEYIVVAQHRESWQSPGALLDSKAELSNFALELSKKMNMRYRSPPMPVDLTVKEGGYPDSLLKPESIVSRIRTTSTGGGSNEEINYNEVAKMFDTSKA